MITAGENEVEVQGVLVSDFVDSVGKEGILWCNIQSRTELRITPLSLGSVL